MKKIKKFRDAIIYNDYLGICKEVDLLTNSRLKAQLRLAVFFLFHYGLRVDDVRFITTNNLNELLSESKTTIQEGKTGRSRSLYLPKSNRSTYRTLVNQFKKTQNDNFEFVMLNTKNCLYSRVYWNKLVNTIIDKYCKKTSKQLRSHSFRIGVVTRLLQSNVSFEDIRQFIGHSSINTTTRYSRYSITDRQLEKLSNILTK